MKSETISSQKTMNAPSAFQSNLIEQMTKVLEKDEEK